MTQRVSVQGFLSAAALALARRHRPVWSAGLRRVVCRCGSDLPCRTREVFIGRQDWPSHRQLAQALAVHRRGEDGFCVDCRMAFGPVRFPCAQARIAVQTFAVELSDRILEHLR
ncbi:hypothetical protein [Micromonospora zhanjiangensis]|uniref:Uncharacterized protein n=1 Tax=Micromonospora zhanjiangensis TaxID=1522057 RepID=A0ABV8KXS0_9ACTN